jgi:hypothetical protein
MEVEKAGLIETALARAVLDKSSKELRDALLAEVWAQHQEELLQQALEQVRQEQQEAEEARRELWETRKAQERRALKKKRSSSFRKALSAAFGN